jgi:hypothetical protein
MNASSEHTPPANDATALSVPAAASGREKILLALVAVALVGLGSGFWFINGARTFGELMLGAFSWCF